MNRLESVILQIVGKSTTLTTSDGEFRDTNALIRRIKKIGYYKGVAVVRLACHTICILAPLMLLDSAFVVC